MARPKKVTEEKKVNYIPQETISNEKLYEGLVCIAMKLDAMLEIFSKIDKEIDRKNGL